MIERRGRTCLLLEPVQPLVIGGEPPRSVTSLLCDDSWRLASQSKLFRESRTARSPISSPRFWTSPMFVNWVFVKPNDGGYCFCTSASIVRCR